MKITVLSIAILFALSTASYAQSTSNVTFYGTVDAGVAYTNNGATSPEPWNTVMLVPAFWMGRALDLKAARILAAD